MRTTRVISIDSPNVTDEITGSKTPVIIRGLINHWDLVKQGEQSAHALQNVLLDYYNKKPVISYQASSDKNGRYFYNDDCSELDFKKVSVSLPDFFNHVEHANSEVDAPSIFVPSMHLDSYFPNMTDIMPLTLEGVEAPLMQAWLGSPSLISCHFDAMKNLACCIAGKRRFTLFPPEQVDNLYVGPIDLTPAGQAISLVDMKNPDFDKHPKFKQALESAEEAILEPGDALFLPSMWWHQVEGLAPFNLMINYWWRTTGRILGEPNDALQHAMLSIRALPIEERQAWQAMFNHYIFSENATEHAHIPQSSLGTLAPLDDRAARRLRAQLIASLNR
jgi:hypothetical protein